MKHQFKQPEHFQDDENAKQLPHTVDEINSIIEQDTLKSAKIKSNDTFMDKLLDGLPNPVQYVVALIYVRVQDAQPEALSSSGLMERNQNVDIGAIPIIACTNALGLLLISFSYYLSRYGNNALEALFLPALLLMFVPCAIRLLSPTPSRLERLSILCMLGISLYIVQFMVSPLHFSSYDEFMHWRTADDILRTGHLFSGNSMLTASPYYPGLEIMTNAISTTSGLSTFQAGVLILCATRLLMMLSLFLFYEQITGSSRMAGIGTIIYTTNPHFLFFDAIFNYETLALPLATFMLYILARYEAMNKKNYRPIIFLAWLVLVAITITHHMTDYVFDGILILWTLISLFQNSSRKFRIHLATIALFGIFLALAYALLLQGNPVLTYLSNYYGSAFTDIGNIIAGVGKARSLFATSSNVPPTPIWDRLLMAGAVALVVFSLPFGWLTLWHQHRYNTLALTFGIFCFAYPISQVFRFTDFGAEITDRSAAFFFLPIAYLLTIFITHFWPTRTWKLNQKAAVLITCGLSIMFLGGVILEGGPAWSNLPGPYIVTADVRSVEPEGIQAASWALLYLGPNNRIATDRIDGILMLTYGDQRIVTGLDDKVDVAPIFYSATFDSKDRGILQEGRIRYLVVDQRLATSLPLVGFYFEEAEAGAFHLTRPISKGALTKFDTIPNVNKVFDSGNIVYYDVGSIGN